MSMSAPSVTVITVVRNDHDGLRRTAESVAAQSHPVQHVVIDGASTDGTRELIEQLRPSLGYASSAPDSGIAQAFNRGLAAARGDWVNFLNAGDVFAGPDVVARAMARVEGQAVVTGQVRMGHLLWPAKAPTTTEHLSRRALLSHQASFVHRSVFDRCGGFDERFRTRMDYEHWLRVLRQYGACFVPELWVVSKPGGQSATQRKSFIEEEYLANRMHLPDAAVINAVAMLRNAVEVVRGRARRAVRRGRRRLRSATG
jgi:glycosyltransferase involved in cell wall biosynthesis